MYLLQTFAIIKIGTRLTVRYWGIKMAEKNVSFSTNHISLRGNQLRNLKNTYPNTPQRLVQHCHCLHQTVILVQKLAETRLIDRPQSKQTKYCFLWLLLTSLVMHVSSYSFFIVFIIFMIQIYHLNHENQKCPVLRAFRRWGTSPYLSSFYFGVFGNVFFEHL